MKAKLIHKVFAAFLGTSLFIVISMAAIMAFYAAENFADYVNKVEMEKLNNLVSKLKEEYVAHQGWDHLRNNPQLWQNILRSEGGLLAFGPPFLPQPPDGGFPKGGPTPGMPPPGGARNEPPPPGAARSEPPPPPPQPFGGPPRLTLFDGQKRVVAGNPHPPEEQLLQAISVEGNTVGWLGLAKAPRLSHPLDVEFAEQQAKAFYLIGIATLCGAMLVSLLLSRHLLRPIRHLTEGTQALSCRQFETRLAIPSKDELGQLASAFNAMAQNLEQYEQMRRQWLSDISHELRTPLAILRAEIEAMQDGVRLVTDETLASLHAEVLHLSKIVDDLRELSSVDSAMLTIRREPVKPLAVLKATLRSFETRFVERGLSLQEELSMPDIGMAGDEDRLKQLFSNILENALKYADAPGTLKIWGQRTPEELTLNFVDSGPGVPEASLDKLFDRLYRVDEARNREQGGSGLGLAICKSIVEALGGRIKAANAPSAGLWIEIRFPLLPV